MSEQAFLAILRRRFGHEHVTELLGKPRERPKVLVAVIGHKYARSEVEAFLKKEFGKLMRREAGLEVAPIEKKPGRTESVDFALRNVMDHSPVAEVSLRASSAGIGGVHHIAYLPISKRK